jgi:exosortase/archaeosortase family protein
MQTIRAILPVLMLLLLASGASAQDIPDLVLIDVDLHWTVPVYGDVRLFGTNEWQNGVGYTNPNIARSGSSFEPVGPWHVTGQFSPCSVCVWTNFPGLNPANDGQFVLDLEQAQLHGEPHFIVPIGGQSVSPVLLPGDYAIGGATFGDPAIGCCPVTSFFAESGHISVTAVPELSILRSFAKHLGGRRLNAFVNPTLQRLTAWGAAKLLGAKSYGVYVVLPTTILEVQEWCSGVSTMKWLMLLAFGLALVTRASMPWKIAFVVVAPLIGLETNILRVAGIGYGYEKELLGWSTFALGVGQVALLGLWVNRTNCRGSES